MGRRVRARVRGREEGNEKRNVKRESGLLLEPTLWRVTKDSVASFQSS